MFETRTGNTLSSHSPEAAELYQKGVGLILGSESGAAETLDRALELDKNFALAAAARYHVAQDVGEADSEKFRTLAERNPRRFSMHVDWSCTIKENGLAPRSQTPFNQLTDSIAEMTAPGRVPPDQRRG